jgi:hypothetical protein
LTVVVPAPEDPVTAITGCFLDMGGSPQNLRLSRNLSGVAFVL